MALSNKDKKAWIISIINATGYSDETGEFELDLSDSEKIHFIADRLRIEAFYPNNVKRFKGNIQDVIADHLMGIPSWINIPYSNHEIIQYGNQWGYDLSTEKKEDKFCNNWFNAIAAGIVQLLNKEGIRL
jgi:hypothetical protein